MDQPYVLEDGIYSDIRILTNTMVNPTEVQKLKYMQQHESVGKDVEHAFPIIVK